MRYKVLFNHPAIKNRFEKILVKVPAKEQDEIMKAVLQLAVNPRPYGVLKIKPPLDIYNYTAQYRIRIGRYRVLYDIDDQKGVVSIITLRKRDEKTYQ